MQKKLKNKDLLKNAVLLLGGKKITDCFLDSELLLSFALQKKREFLLAHLDDYVDFSVVKKFDTFLKKRLSGESVAVILGEKEFYGRKFIVNKNVLIPRPLTELMIDNVLHDLREEREKTLIIDIGTGSGCIIVTLASELFRDNFSFLSVDISSKALKTAKLNAERHKCLKKISFQKSNLLQVFLKKKADFKKIIICANLPYLTKEEIVYSPSIQKEPFLALYGGVDGLDYYKDLAEQIKILQNNNPKAEIVLYAEINNSQEQKFNTLFADLEDC